MVQGSGFRVQGLNINHILPGRIGLVLGFRGRV